jgi:hypothetical protein
MFVVLVINFMPNFVLVVSVAWWGNVNERGHLGDPGVDGRIKMDLQAAGCGDVGMWTGSS